MNNQSTYPSKAKGLQTNEALYLAELRKYKKDAVTAARELGYGEDIVRKIKKLQKIVDISNLMANTRANKNN